MYEERCIHPLVDAKGAEAGARDTVGAVQADDVVVWSTKELIDALVERHERLVQPEIGHDGSLCDVKKSASEDIGV